MKIGTVRKFRTWCLRKRDLHAQAHEQEPFGPMNLYRPRLAGKVEAYDAVIGRIDALIKNNHDRFHDRRKKHG